MITKIGRTGIIWKHDMKLIVNTTSSTTERKSITGTGDIVIRTTIEEERQESGACADRYASAAGAKVKEKEPVPEGSRLFLSAGSLTEVLLQQRAAG
jgi:hypothetical protein